MWGDLVRLFVVVDHVVVIVVVVGLWGEDGVRDTHRVPQEEDVGGAGGGGALPRGADAGGGALPGGADAGGGRGLAAAAQAAVAAAARAHGVVLGGGRAALGVHLLLFILASEGRDEAVRERRGGGRGGVGGELGPHHRDKIHHLAIREDLFTFPALSLPDPEGNKTRLNSPHKV